VVSGQVVITSGSPSPAIRAIASRSRSTCAANAKVCSGALEGAPIDASPSAPAAATAIATGHRSRGTTRRYAAIAHPISTASPGCNGSA